MPRKFDPAPPENASMREAESSPPAAAHATQPNTLRLQHELEVHQIELMSQNTQLRQAHDELEAGLARYTELYDSSPVGYLIIDREGVVLTLNLAGAGLLERPRSEVRGRRFLIFIAPESCAAFNDFLARVLTGQSGVSCEVTLPGGDGLPRVVQIQGSLAEAGQECRLVLQDISATKALERSERRYRQLLEAAPNAVYINQQGKFTYLNPAALRLFGAGDAHELLGTRVLDRVLAGNQGLMDERLRILTEERRPLPALETTFIRLDGTPVEVEVIAVPYLDQKHAGAQVIARDISARKRGEAALIASEMRYRNLVEHLHAGLVLHGADTAILLANSAAIELLGLTLDQMLGKTAIDPDWCFQHEDGAVMEPADYPVRQVLERDAEIINQVVSVRRPVSGYLKWLLVNAYPERDEQGCIQQVVVAFVDITERKTAEVLLRQDREQQKTLREMLEDVVRGGTLKETLAACLARLLSVSWLALEPRGGIFLMDGQALRLTVAQGLSAEILNLCDQVPLDRCHCGRAATSREMQFSPCLDHRHEVSYPGMVEHGHYNLPLLSEGDVLGVIMLYVPHNFERDPVKEAFLRSVADVLAGFIRRKQAEEALRQLNEELEDRIMVRTHALVAARDEAQRANLAKSEFLSRMSHELRTPLHAILGFGQLLELNIREEEPADNVQEVLHAGRHLLELINEVLDLARVDAGKFTVSQEPVPLLPLIADCVSLIRPQAEARSIGIVEAGRVCGEYVLADRVRLKQVLLNLLSNAVKYNREGGEIFIACVPEGKAIQIRISDTGAGLSAEQQARLFVAFERLDADKHAIEGTGIGLALSKRLVELMQGEIGVESTPGQGSTFWVRLPIADGHAEEPHDTAAVASDDQTSSFGSHQQWGVLCIEDNPANLRLIERILSRRDDIRLLTAVAPGLGLELAEAHQPALILLDINLPDMDGYDVMQCLRENPATRDIPVVAISANAMPKDLARGKAAGFQDYLTKPLEVGRLLAVVDAFIGTLAPPVLPEQGNEHVA